MTFYAKPNQTYREHLEAVYSAWKETIDAKRPLIERLAKKYNFSYERFVTGSLLTVAFHDIGKMIEPFQQMMEAKRNGNSFDITTNYRHELVSFIYAAKYGHQIQQNNNYLASIPIEALAVVGHHRSLDADLTSFDRESTSPLPVVFPDGINEAILIAEELFKKEGLVLPSIPSVKNNSHYENPCKSLAALISTGRLNKGIEKDGPEKIRALYFLLKGILHYADWHGSGKVPVRYKIESEINSIVHEIENHCREKGIPYDGIRPFQKTCSDHSGHLIAVAPTGSGKTEASIFWALKNMKEMGGAKVVYLLPTMVTANSIWERMVKYLGRENVGLTHSTANLFLQTNSVEGEEDIWENRRDRKSVV